MTMPPVSQPVGRPADHRPSGPSLQLHAKRTARRLGWFSIARGLLQVLRPGDFARAIGTRGSVPARLITRLGGLREIAAGVGILTTPRPATWLSSRVAGDMMDLGLLGVAFTAPSARRSRLLAAMAAVAGATVLDARCAQRLTGPPSTSGRAVRARRSITINRTAEELYRFWRDFRTCRGSWSTSSPCRRSATGARTGRRRGPVGMTVEWDAEITEDRPGELIAWRSVPGRRARHGRRRALRPRAGRPGHRGPRRAAVRPAGRKRRRTLARSCSARSPSSRCRTTCAASSRSWRPGEVVASDGRERRRARLAPRRPPAA